MRDKKKLRDIIDAIEAIEAYSVSSYEEFLADAKTRDAGEDKALENSVHRYGLVTQLCFQQTLEFCN